MNSSVGMHAAYLLPMAAYILISIFAMRAGKAPVVSRDSGTAAVGH
jgi:hypothetical protein